MRALDIKRIATGIGLAGLLMGVTALSAATLDIDDNGAVEGQTDGQLVLRYLLGLRGADLSTGFTGADAGRNAAAIEEYLGALDLALDLDGDGRADALSDGILILRHLRGDVGDALTTGAIAPEATRDADAISDYIDALAALEEPAFTGGDSYPPDSNLRVATFRSLSAPAVSTLAVLGETAPLRSSAGGASATSQAATQPLSTVRWMSQSSPSCEDNSNGFCGFASVLMGADYLLGGATEPRAPSELGHNQATADWIHESVETIFDGSSYTNCGGAVGINPYDFDAFARGLGLQGGVDQFNGRNEEAEAWLTAALANGLPVVLRVPYQKRDKCSAWADSQADFYSGGEKIREMKACSGARHWVLAVGIDQDSVLIYDPDPYADTPEAGIRRYSKSSFFDVLPDPRAGYQVPISPDRKGTTWMYRLCPSAAACDYAPEAFTAVGTVVLGANEPYTPDDTQPVATPLVPNAEFEATGLPAGLEMDSDGRILVYGVKSCIATSHNVHGVKSCIATSQIGRRRMLWPRALGPSKRESWGSLAHPSLREERTPACSAGRERPVGRESDSASRV